MAVKANEVKSTEKCYDLYKETCFRKQKEKKEVNQWAKHGFATRACIELKQFKERRRQRLSGKKKTFHVLWSVKKVMLTVFCDMKRPITIDYLEKGPKSKQCFLLLTL